LELGASKDLLNKHNLSGGQMSNELGFEVTLQQPYEQALETVTAALKVEGFGVLTRIDVKATMKEKLGADFRPYAILGACNPPLAFKALSNDASAGLLLPCNVTVEALDSGSSLVRIIDPDMMLQAGPIANNPAIKEVAAEAKARLQRVAAALAANG
jgi:uncharacterized protein (DUF302 family)